MAECSFCNKSNSRVDYMIATREKPQLFICGECIDLCHEMLIKEKTRRHPDIEVKEVAPINANRINSIVKNLSANEGLLNFTEKVIGIYNSENPELTVSIIGLISSIYPLRRYTSETIPFPPQSPST